MNVFFTATFVCFCYSTVVAGDDGPDADCMEACPDLAALAKLSDESDRRLAAKLQEELAAVIGEHRRLSDPADPTAMFDAFCTDSIITGVECMKTKAECASTVESMSESEDAATMLGLPCLCKTCPLKDVMEDMLASMTPEEGAELNPMGMIVAMFDMMCKIAPIAECMEAENENEAGSCPTAMIEEMTQGLGNASSACLCSICPAVDTLKEIVITSSENATDEEELANLCKMLSVDGCFEKANAEEAGLCPSDGMMGMMGGPSLDMSNITKACEDKGLLTDIEPVMPSDLISVGFRTAPRTMLAAASVAMVWCGA